MSENNVSNVNELLITLQTFYTVTRDRQMLQIIFHNGEQDRKKYTYKVPCTYT